MKKRVVIDASAALPRSSGYLSGVGRTTLELIRAMSHVDHDLEIILYSQRLRGKRLGSYALDTKNVHCPLPRWKPIESLIRKYAVIERLTSGRLYHAPGNYSPVFGKLDKTIVTLHDAMFLTYPESFLGHEEMARTVPPFVRNCRAVLTCSEHSKRDIVEHIGVEPDRVHVIYWGCDRSVFYPAVEADHVRERLSVDLGLERPYFLSVSCNIGRKNTEGLLAVYRQLADSGVRNDLVLVWPRVPERILQLSSCGSLAGRVHFLRDVSDDLLGDLYRGATASVFPSLYEGFGLPVLESMCCGTPVVTSDVTSMPEIGGKAAVYVDPRDQASLYQALESFDDGRDDVDAMRSRCLARAQYFTWERCAAETIKVYERYL